MDLFAPATRAWFAATFGRPTPVQEHGWPCIATGDHTLLLAPTGSGKTLAAFLWGIDRTMRQPCDAPPGVRVLYVSPLKALIYDVERNLRVPLTGIHESATARGDRLHRVRIDVRTGDTSQALRRRQCKNPAEILVTTPESLFLLLGSAARATLASVRTVIVDEVHALAPTKRGAHLALSLERLSELAVSEPQRIGLSATVRPVDEIARFLGGDRPVQVVDVATPPDLALAISVPVPDMEAPHAVAAQAAGPIPPRRGMWPVIYPEIVRHVRDHRSTIVFVNSRSLCERLAHKLNELAGEELVLAHHGSISHARRAEIEGALKAGRLRGIVATSSLELGIDMGAVDLVILVESPGSVARGLQRVGRAGHRVGETSRGIVFPKFRGDLLECAVVAERMLRGELEETRMPRNPLDVLAQQIVAMVCERPRRVDDVARVVRRAAPYAQLGDMAFAGVLDMLAGHYPSDDFADLRPRISWDRATDVLHARRGAAMLSRLNAGTIPDRGLFHVHLGAGGPRIGELDEEMTYESRPGDVILLGASSWRITDITRDRVVVEPAAGEPGRLPFWRGDGLGRSRELGRAIGAFVRELAAQPPVTAVTWLQDRVPLDRHAAENLVAFVAEQRAHTGTLPTDRSITVERFRDELGDWRVCILTPFGARVHAPWTMALRTRLVARRGVELVSMYGDDGIVLTFAGNDEPPDVAALFPDPEELEELVVNQLAGSALFGGAFRENAARALLLPRRRPAARAPLWAQRLRAKNLLASVLRYPDFPIVLETYRQCLQDTFDLPGLADILRAVRSRELRVDSVETRAASPFARSLAFAWVAAYMYEYDAPLAERRAQALTLDRDLLRELLGEEELRAFVDAEVLVALEQDLQHVAADRRARDVDELHDLLRRLGALDGAELAERSEGPPAPWLETLCAEQRAVPLRLGGREVWIAAQDAGLYRDALGVDLPEGLPAAFLAPAADAVAVLVRRHARTHGPFLVEEVAARLELPAARVLAVLEGLEREGVLVRGEIRPGGMGRQWCDLEVLRRLKRQTLAKLRNEVAAVAETAYARFLPSWHGIGARGGEGIARLQDVLVQLEGCPLPWSALSLSVLPGRVPGFSPDMLDVLSASGQVLWVGMGALGPEDGRIALFRREAAARLLPAPVPPPEGAHAAAVLACLAERGASFTTVLEQAARCVEPSLGKREFEALLYDLVWAGQITNDTFGPLRSLPASRRPSRRAPGMMGGRWSLVRDLVEPGTSDTAYAHARATMLLERYGIVSREAAIAEGLPGGFAAVYEVLKAMEEAGQIRRGHFVDGLAGAQFALSGAVDRLRYLREAGDEPAACVLDATDPANPWGAILAWPAGAGGEEARPRRVPGAMLVEVDGEPVVWVSASRRRLVTFTALQDAERARPALDALRALPGSGRSLIVEQIDGVAARQSPLASVLIAHGFVHDYRGLVLAR